MKKFNFELKIKKFNKYMTNFTLTLQNTNV